MNSPFPSLRLGFIPLMDAAIPIVAARKGFAAAHGIDLQLVRETSWANIRDRLAIGHLDAAHLLAPMPVAAALGLAPLDTALIAPMALGTGGNAITFSAELADAVRKAGEIAFPAEPAALGKALRAVIAMRAGEGKDRLTFGVVHPYSAHNYELRYWLAASGIDPDRDLDIVILPPPFMPDALASQRIDAFCVGEPWNTVACRRAGGTIVLTKAAIWRASPEKVLALREDWATAHPARLAALMQALLDAALWCEAAENRGELVRLLSAPDLLDLPPEDLLPALDGSLDGVGRFLTYAAEQANFPWKSDAEWFLGQMRRWHQIGAGQGDPIRVRTVFRPDILRAALLARKVSCPLSDDRPEAAEHKAGIIVPGTLGDVRLPRFGFFDAGAQAEV